MTSALRGPLIVLHGLAVGALLTSLVTGLAMAALFRPWLAALSPLLPQGALLHGHLLAAALWLLLFLAYLLLRGLGYRPPSRGRRVVRLGLALIGLAALTGAGLYLGVSDKQAYLRELHALLALGLLLYLLVHPLLEWRRGGLPRWLAFLLPGTPWPRPAWRAFALMLALAGGVAGLTGSEGALPGETLRLIRIPVEAIPTVDGDGSEPVWAQAQPVTVLTEQPGNRAVPTIPVTVRALSDGYTAFFQFRWPDSSPSLMHLPLIKRSEGWQVLHEGFEKADERRYYEDKFAVMLANSPKAGGAGSMQRGHKPLPGQPAPLHGRGYHYTDGALLDVWHWKAVRNHDFGNLDDSHIGPPAPPQAAAPRYSAGYRADPKDAGGYTENWAWFKPGVVVPKRLPKDPARLAQFQGDSTPESIAPERIWGLPWSETLAYSPERDTYPPGTRLPSVLWLDHLEGDRGDVQARARWQDGRWTLEVARSLRSSSPFDLPIADGVYLWLAVFDHTQTRHSQHLRPLRLTEDRATP